MMMYLFILESIGTAELILIGIVALIFLGPRKLPSIARTIGKTMADLRNTTNEFKSTWEREVNFEEETKAFRVDNLLDDESPLKNTTPPPAIQADGIGAPEIKEIDAVNFSQGGEPATNGKSDENREQGSPAEDDTLVEKQNWL